MDNSKALPPGQVQVPEMLRFGLPTFAKKIKKGLDKVEIKINGDVKSPLLVTDQLRTLVRVDQVSDFHCVTTWSVVDLNWGGYRFKEFYEQIVVPDAQPNETVKYVVFEGLDGYRVSMVLADLLNEDVLLADSLYGQDLGLAHGAPMRLVAPAHYGYKNIKHIVAIRFLASLDAYSFPFPYPNRMEHLRARVALEERGLLENKKLIRRLYRMLIPVVRYWFKLMG